MCLWCGTSRIADSFTAGFCRAAPTRRRFLAYAASAGGSTMSVMRGALAAEGADVIFRNGTIHPMTGRPGAGRSARDRPADRILAAGSASDVSALARGATSKIVDLQGRALFPGFIDPHHHTVLSALLRRSADQTSGTRSTEARRRARRDQGDGREDAAGPVDRARLLRQSLAGRRPVDGGAGRGLDPSIRFSSCT